MKVLIVHAHENPASFSSCMMNRAKLFFERRDHSVTVSNLYEKRFNPVVSARDFVKLTGGYYHVLDEQLNASRNNLFTEDIRIEMKLLTNADVVVFSFPLWWYSVPAILKGWFDRILACGFAYGHTDGTYERGAMRGKKAMLMMTLDGKLATFEPSGTYGQSMNDMLHSITHGTLKYVGFQLLPSFYAHSVSYLNDLQKDRILSELEAHLIRTAIASTFEVK